MEKQEVRQVNNLLLIQLCKEVGKKEIIDKQKAQMCTLIINEAITKLKGV